VTGVFDGILTVFVRIGVKVRVPVDIGGFVLVFSISVGRMAGFEAEQPKQNNARHITLHWMRTFHEKGIK
jgi:hypothetical protein